MRIVHDKGFYLKVMFRLMKEEITGEEFSIKKNRARVESNIMVLSVSFHWNRKNT